MKRSISLASLAFVVVACRAVVGIEDQGLATGAANDAATDAGGSDAGADAREAGPSKPPANPSCAGKVGGECQKCCRDLAPSENQKFDSYLKACACGTSGACTTECASELCAVGGGPGAPGSPCLNCVTDLALKPSCSAVQECAADSACEAIGTCIWGTCE